jgi:hypothetical protein
MSGLLRKEDSKRGQGTHLPERRVINSGWTAPWDINVTIPRIRRCGGFSASILFMQCHQQINKLILCNCAGIGFCMERERLAFYGDGAGLGARALLGESSPLLGEWGNFGISRYFLFYKYDYMKI